MDKCIKKEDAAEAVWRILNGMGISQKHNERLAKEVDAVLDEYQTEDVFIGRDFRDCRYRKIVPNRTINRRMVYRGAVYNAIEAERINHLDGILTDRYKDGFHDGLKRALEILGRLPDAEEGE